MHKKRDTILVFFVIALSGIPPINWQAPVILPVLSVILLIVFYTKRLKIDRFFYIVLLFLIFLTFIHIIQFKQFSFKTTAGLFVRFTFPYLAYKIIGRDRFINKYIDLIYYFSLISFFFLIPSIISPGFHKFVFYIAKISGLDYINPIPQHFILYTVEARNDFGLIENSGPFWEHGAFSGFLIIALLFNVIYLGKSLKEKRNIVFIIAIITTLSTTGYLMLYFFVTGYLILIPRKNKVLNLLFIFPLLLYLSWISFNDLDFLKTKLNSQVNTQIENYTPGMGGGRFISALTDLNEIKESPLFGKGRISTIRFKGFYYDPNSKIFHRTNGITDLIVKYGILFSVFYFYYYYKGFKLLAEKYFKYRKKTVALFILFIIMMFGFSQTIFQQSLFILLLYFHLNDNRNIKRTQIIQINEN